MSALVWLDVRDDHGQLASRLNLDELIPKDLNLVAWVRERTHHVKVVTIACKSIQTDDLDCLSQAGNNELFDIVASLLEGALGLGIEPGGPRAGEVLEHVLEGAVCLEGGLMVPVDVMVAQCRKSGV